LALFDLNFFYQNKHYLELNWLEFWGFWFIWTFKTFGKKISSLIIFRNRTSWRELTHHYMTKSQNYNKKKIN